MLVILIGQFRKMEVTLSTEIVALAKPSALKFAADYC